MPKEFTYEDEDVMVFPDIHPVKPVHLLVMPKKHVKELIDSDNEVLNKVFETVKKMINEKGLNTGGYHLMINGGGAQLVDHFHVHVTGPFAENEASHAVDKRLEN